ncbi:prolyl oligopeptidase family serine peptidase [Micrococcoides hystricis]|uniref:Prolyl oligopeptidase family protein n=1 Tax=Micrococcoides hystricis TaxID=1572761 RepID=A0ABV6PAY8_9MICC
MSEHDPYLWLENIHGDDALSWVREQNAATEAELYDDQYRRLVAEHLEVLNSAEKIPAPSQRGQYVYNFWQDAEHPRGLWRRTPVDSYASQNPEWEVLLDVDELSAQEGVEWVFTGASPLRPDDDRAMVALSPDGGDATQLREFDLRRGSFRDASEDGFFVETAKTWFSWLDADTLLVAVPLDDSDTTASSYPATVRLLRRGTELADAPVIFSTSLDHLGTSAGFDPDPDYPRLLASDVIDFFNAREYVHTGTDFHDPVFTQIPVPTHMRVSFHKQWMLLYPREEYKYAPGQLVPGGSLLIVNAEEFLTGNAIPTVVFTPDDSSALQSWTFLSDALVLNVLQDVATTVLAFHLQQDQDDVKVSALDVDTSVLTGSDQYQMFSFSRVDRFGPDPDELWLTTTGFLTPTTLYRAKFDVDLSAQKATLRATVVKRSPAFFDAEQYRVEQHFVRSKDGTSVPYFMISAKDAVLDGKNPTLLSGYGGFQLSRTPGYEPAVAIGWLDQKDSEGRHGVYVLANIRGGGEYGPRWHQAALQQHRHRAYEDFAAVAQDLVARNVTAPQHLAAAGGSNGGLLIGNMLMQYPELFGALSCGVPLLDMRRYTQLSAGHSWIAEYGDPDVPEQWEFIKTFSPYHLVDELSDEQLKQLPATLIWTATSDDRVGPVQARKLAAKLFERGADQMRFHEVLDGGHSGAADQQARAELLARYQRFLFDRVAVQ